LPGKTPLLSADDSVYYKINFSEKIFPAWADQHGLNHGPARPPTSLDEVLRAGSATRLQRYAQHFGQAALQAGARKNLVVSSGAEEKEISAWADQHGLKPRNTRKTQK